MNITFDTIMNDASRFQRSVRHRNAREYVAAVAVLGVFVWLAVKPDEPLLARVASIVLMMGVAVGMTHMHLRGHAADVPGTSVSTREMLSWHRRELERQRDLLSRVPLWYVGPILPGVVLFLVAAAMRAQRPLVLAFVTAVVLAILASILWLNRRAKNGLDARIAALPREDEDT